MLSHIYTLSVEQFTITVIAGLSEIPDRSLSFFSFFYTDILTKKKKRRKKFHIGFELIANEAPNNRMCLQTLELFLFIFVLYRRFLCAEQKGTGQINVEKFLVLPSIS